MPRVATQALAVLFRDAPTLGAVQGALALFDPAPLAERPEASWTTSGPGVRVALDGSQGGVCDVDVVARPWPDALSDPSDAEVFAAFGLGAFGPHTTAHALIRGADFSTHEARRFPGVPPHGAFVRLRTRYVGKGATEEGRSPVAELELLSALAAALAGIEGAVAVFAPGGDLLFTPDTHRELHRLARTAPRELLRLWVNVRALKNEGWAGNLLFDTIGMRQLDLVDHEAWFPERLFASGLVAPHQIASFLRAMCDLERERGLVMKTGETAGGHAGVWRVTLGDATWGQPRPVRHWELVEPPR